MGCGCCCDDGTKGPHFKNGGGAKHARVRAGPEVYSDRLLT
jgi:hypothetical protein